MLKTLTNLLTKDSNSQVTTRAPAETKQEVETTQWAQTKITIYTKRDNPKAAELVLPQTTANL